MSLSLYTIYDILLSCDTQMIRLSYTSQLIMKCNSSILISCSVHLCRAVSAFIQVTFWDNEGHSQRMHWLACTG